MAEDMKIPCTGRLMLGGGYRGFLAPGAAATAAPEKIFAMMWISHLYNGFHTLLLPRVSGVD